MSGRIRRAEGSGPGEPVAPPRDESPPESGGLFRRIAPGQGGALSGMIGAFETVFAPGKEQARQEIQRQRHAGRGTPAPTDPPSDDDLPDENRVAAPGRRGTPFSGFIVIQPPAREP